MLFVGRGVTKPNFTDMICLFLGIFDSFYFIFGQNMPIFDVFDPIFAISRIWWIWKKGLRYAPEQNLHFDSSLMFPNNWTQYSVWHSNSKWHFHKTRSWRFRYSIGTWLRVTIWLVKQKWTWKIVISHAIEPPAGCLKPTPFTGTISGGTPWNRVRHWTSCVEIIK